MAPPERSPAELDGTCFAAAYRGVLGLARHERYIAAFIFGSVARGEGGPWSDFDVKVVVGGDDPDDRLLHLSHPIIGGVK
jgi:predicted nucleotidyltransferase